MTREELVAALLDEVTGFGDFVKIEDVIVLGCLDLLGADRPGHVSNRRSERAARVVKLLAATQDVLLDEATS